MEEWKRTTHRGSIPPEDSLILTAIIPTPRDLEIARVLGWYRIPFKFAPKIVYVDYLAFYQPGIFGEPSGGRLFAMSRNTLGLMKNIIKSNLVILLPLKIQSLQVNGRELLFYIPRAVGSKKLR